MTVHRLGDHITGDPDPDDDIHLEPIKKFDWERYIRRAGIQPTTKLVGLVMATYGNGKGEQIHPGDEMLALDCGITRRAVITHRTILEQLGFIKRIGEPRRGPNGRAAEYVLTWPSNFNHLDGSRGPDGGPPLDL